MSSVLDTTLIVDGPAGPLEVHCESPADEAGIKGWGLVLHPHPLMGGSMNHKVPYILSRILLEMGYVSIRFNFRGVGASEGSYGEGYGEIDDAIAMLDWAKKRYSHLEKSVLFGFSFGAFVGSHLANQENHQFDHIVLAGMPAGRFECQPVPAHSLIVHGELDEIVPLKNVLEWAAPQTTPVTVFPQCSHFFDYKLVQFKDYILSILVK